MSTGRVSSEGVKYRVSIEFKRIGNHQAYVTTGLADSFNFRDIPGVVFLEFNDGETKYYPLSNIVEISIIEIPDGPSLQDQLFATDEKEVN